MFGLEVGLFGLLLLIANVYAIVKTVGSHSAGTGGKVIWIVLILIFPFLGFLLWLLFGPR